MTALQTAFLSTAVSAVVTVVVGTLMQWGARIADLVRRRITPDHHPMSAGNGWSSTRTESSGARVRVLVCCAPNRTRRRKEINPDVAVQFIHEAFGRWVGNEPVYSTPYEGVRFEGDEYVDRAYAWAHAGGRVDLCRTIHTTTVGTSVSVDVEDILEVISAVHTAVSSPLYATVFGRRLMGLPRRFDWTIAVSTSVTIPSAGAHYWQHLNFPDGPPPRRGTQQQPFLPPRGYAADALRNWTPRWSCERLLHVFLSDFLYTNGYNDVDDAINRTVSR